MTNSNNKEEKIYCLLSNHGSGCIYCGKGMYGAQKRICSVSPTPDSMKSSLKEEILRQCKIRQLPYSAVSYEQKPSENAPQPRTEPIRNPRDKDK